MSSLQSYIKDYYFPLMKIQDTSLINPLILFIENNDKEGIIKTYDEIVEFIKNDVPKEKYENINKYFNRFRVDLNNDFGLTFNYIYFV
jgi:hypothetical protein